MTDRSGFDEFVHARGACPRATAYLLTGDHHLAEDLVQAALVQAARHWERIETSPGGLRAPHDVPPEHLLVAAPQARRDAAGVVRRRCRRPTRPCGSPSSRHCARLTPSQRTVLVLRYFEDLTEVRTAAELGISGGAVKSMSRQALPRLRDLAPELADLVGADP